MSDTSSTAKSRPKENLIANLVCNVFLPGFILTKFSGTGQSAEKAKGLLDGLYAKLAVGPLWALVIALSLPLGYGLWDWMRRREWNIFSTLGIVGTLATGSLGLGTHFGWWKATALWYAIKEAAIPLLIGLSIPLTLSSKTPLVRKLIYNDQVLDTQRIAAALRERNAESSFDALLRGSSILLAISFIISAALNFFLAMWLLKAEPNTEEWNAQLGRMNWLSWPVIVVPSMAMMIWALFRLMNGIQKLTGLKPDDMFHQHAKPKS
jgi:hypothetical protein